MKKISRKKFSANVKKLAKATNLPQVSIRRLFTKRKEELAKITSKKRPATSFRLRERSHVIQKYQKRFHVDYDKAKLYYDTIGKVQKDRIKIVVFKDPRRAAYLSATEAKEFGRPIKKGKNKGKFVAYYDNLFKLPIGGEALKRLRQNMQVERITARLLNTEFTDLKGLKKYFSKLERRSISHRREKLPTLAEAQGAAAKIQENIKETFREYIKVFGETP